MTSLQKTFVIIGSLSLATSAMLSAYGFHGLADVLSPEKQKSWAWAVDMQVYHSLGLILIAILSRQFNGPLLFKLAGWLMVLGMIVFSGSIYAECLGAPPAIGEIAPIGGSSFMLGWVLVATGVFRADSAE